MTPTDSPNKQALAEFANQAYQDFLGQTLPENLPVIAEPVRSIDLQCNLLPPGNVTRRLLLESEPGETVVRVIVEATYQVFEGDTHFHIRCVGKAPRDQAAETIPPLLRAGFEEIMGWHPDHDSVWERAF